jgi:RimJ/RimL family protein N-acetyltransferase
VIVKFLQFFEQVRGDNMNIEIITDKTLDSFSKEDLDELDEYLFGDVYPKDTGFWWSAIIDEKLAGFIGLTKIRKGVGFLCRVGVHEDYRGRGIQASMMEHIEDYACHSAEINEIISYVVASNIFSNNNFIKCGYKMYIPDFCWYDTGYLYWRKNIGRKINRIGIV